MVHDPILGALQQAVDAGDLAGVATLTWRAGRPAEVRCAGRRDLDAGDLAQRDTIFRIASMTKPVTSVAALQLWEEGRIALDEPITRWAPEFAAPRVMRRAGGPLDDTAPAPRPITFGDLLTHRSGLTYGALASGPLAEGYAALGGDIDSPLAPDRWIAELARLPLVAPPGAAFHYGHSTDLLGLLIARIEGRTLGEVLRRRLFDPLGMGDTGFCVPRSERGRRAAAHGFGPDDLLVRLDAPPGGAALPERPDHHPFEGGGAGLWSTVDDYLAFARLFVEGGASGRTRILKPETVARMTTNQLTPEQRAGAELLGTRPFAAGHGFGLGVAVVTEPERAEVFRCGGGAGSVGWPGAYGGWWQADPNDRSVLVFLTHNMVELEQLARGVGLGVYAAIATFQRLAVRA